ncbi:MAG: hypothetical protein ACYSU0_15235 [Planctomycetota bacterium]|jgi:hypothetical protein
MAEVDFFMTKKDSLDFVSFLIEAFSAEFVPERNESAPPFPRYSSIADVKRRIDEDEYYSRFSVLSPLWERYPLGISEVHANDGQHFYSVCQRYGGPSFDLILSRIGMDGDARYLIPGSFSDYPYYIREFFLTDKSRYETFDRPPEMAKAYRDVQKYLRRTGCRSVCRETGRTGPWIIGDALREFQRGCWLRIGDWHCVPKEKRQKPTIECSEGKGRR